jgi:hypothetical protein
MRFNTSTYYFTIKKIKENNLFKNYKSDINNFSYENCQIYAIIVLLEHFKIEKL